MTFQTPASTSPGKTIPLSLEKINPGSWASSEPSSSDCPLGLSKKIATMPDASDIEFKVTESLRIEPTQQPAINGLWNSRGTVVFSLAGTARLVKMSASNGAPIALHNGMVTVLVLLVVLLVLLVVLLVPVVVLVLIVLALALVEVGPYGSYGMVPSVVPPPTAAPPWMLYCHGAKALVGVKVGLRQIAHISAQLKKDLLFVQTLHIFEIAS